MITGTIKAREAFDVICREVFGMDEELLKDIAQQLRNNNWNAPAMQTFFAKSDPNIKRDLRRLLSTIGGGVDDDLEDEELDAAQHDDYMERDPEYDDMDDEDDDFGADVHHAGRDDVEDGFDSRPYSLARESFIGFLVNENDMKVAKYKAAETEQHAKDVEEFGGVTMRQYSRMDPKRKEMIDRKVAQKKPKSKDPIDKKIEMLQMQIQRLRDQKGNR